MSLKNFVFLYLSILMVGVTCYLIHEYIQYKIIDSKNAAIHSAITSGVGCDELIKLIKEE